MYKIILVLFGALVATNINAQVGIGTTNPAMQLHVSNGDSAVALFENRQKLDTDTSTALYFKTGSGIYPYTGGIKTIGVSSTSARLGFFTYASGNPNFLQERVSIADGGNVGIGIKDPSMLLHVAGYASDLATFENANPLDAGVSNAVYFKTGSGSNPFTGAIKTIGQSAAAARLGFFTLASANIFGLKEQMSIGNDGNVGIGITSPAASLSVARGTGGDGTAAFWGTDNVSHFNYAATENTYIRGGKISSVVYINDTNTGDVLIGSGNARVGIYGRVAMSVRHADFFSSSYVYINDNDYTVLIDFSNSAYLGRNIILPAAAGKPGVVYNIVAINLPYTGSYIPANIIEGGSDTNISYINSGQLNVSVQSDGASWYVISRGKGY